MSKFFFTLPNTKEKRISPSSSFVLDLRNLSTFSFVHWEQKDKNDNQDYFKIAEHQKEMHQSNPIIKL